MNAKGERRVYLGGKSSLECWIAPSIDKKSWSLHLETAVTGNPVSSHERSAWAFHTLVTLAGELGVDPEDFQTVSFERIAALHMENPFNSRRCALPRNRAIENGFVSAAPRETRVISISTDDLRRSPPDASPSEQAIGEQASVRTKVSAR